MTRMLRPHLGSSLLLTLLWVLFPPHALAQPPNDSCANSQSLTLNGPIVSGTTIGSTPQLGGDTGVWYSVTGTGQALVASTCADETDFISSLQVYSACDADVLATGVPDSGCPSAQASTATWDSVDGTTYYIFVSGVVAQGNFGISVESLQGPGNDLCTSATTLEINGPVTVGDTIHSTLDRFDDSGGVDIVLRGVWYFVLGTGKPLTASTCYDTTDFITQIYVQPECDILENSVGESRGDFSNGCDNARGASVSWTPPVGSANYIFVGGLEASSTGNFAIRVTDADGTPLPSPPAVTPGSPPASNPAVALPDGPATDQCVNAATLAVNGGEVTSGSTTGAAVNSFGSTGGVQVTRRGVWHLVVGTGRPFSISTCSSATNFETELWLRTSCDASQASVQVSSKDDSCSSGLGSVLTWDTQPDVLYYIFVGGISQDTTGNFGISLVDFVPPPNDLCLDAAPIVLNGPTQVGYTTNATQETFDGADGADVTHRGVWYIVVGNGNTFEVSTCSSQTSFQSLLYVRPECRVTANAVVEGVSDDTCPDTARAVKAQWDTRAGTVYYIYVTSLYDGVTGQFGLSVKDFAAPSNDVCEASTVLSVNGPAVVGDTTTATPDIFDDMTDDVVVMRGAWFIMNGVVGNLTATTCFDTTDYITEIYVKVNCKSSRNALAVSTADSSCGNARGATVRWSSDTNQIFYLVVGGIDRDTTGNFAVRVTDDSGSPIPSPPAVIGPPAPPTSSPNALPEGPAGLLCTDATTLSRNAGIVTGTTANSFVSIFLTTGGFQLSRAGVWHIVVGNGRTTTVTTCSDATDFETQLWLRDDCDPLSNSLEFGRQDTSCSNAFASTITWDSVPNKLYYVFVGGNSDVSVGNFGISLVDAEPPTNDLCLDGVPLEVNGPIVFGTSTSATPDSFRSPSGSRLTRRGSWFLAVGNGMELTASTCFERTDFATQIYVFSSCDSTQPAVTASVSDSSCVHSGASAAVWNSVKDTLYFVFVAGTDSSISSTGDFSIRVTDSMAQPATPPPTMTPTVTPPMTPPPTSPPSSSPTVPVSPSPTVVNSTAAPTLATPMPSLSPSSPGETAAPSQSASPTGANDTAQPTLPPSTPSPTTSGQTAAPTTSSQTAAPTVSGQTTTPGPSAGSSSVETPASVFDTSAPTGSAGVVASYLAAIGTTLLLCLTLI